MALLALLACGSATPLLAHTVVDAVPFHLSPEDHFTITVSGGTFSAPSDVTAQAAPVGGGSPIALTVVAVAGSATVDVRLPATIAVGEYEVLVSIGATAQTGAGPHIWVRQRTLRLIKKTAPKPFVYTNPGADFKEADFVDIEGDGDLDVYAANSLSGSDVDMLFMNQASSTAAGCGTPFCEERATRVTQQSGGGLDYQRTYDADFVDLDGDGDLDLVRTDQSSTAPLRIFENTGSGQLRERTIDASPIVGYIASLGAIQSAVGNWPAEMDYGDINGDGRKDILLCSWYGTLGLLLNEIPSTGKLRLMDLGCSGGSPSALCDTVTPANRGCAFGDFNNDGRLDIIAPEYGGGQPLVFLHTSNTSVGAASPDPQFSSQSNWAKDTSGGDLSMHGGDLKVADLDGDGDHDVALASPGQGGTPHAYVLWNDNGTALRAINPEPSPFVGDAYDVAFNDLDADGDLDLVFAKEYSSNSNRVLINHGGKNGALLFKEYSPAGSIWYEESPFGPPAPSGASSATFDLSVSFGDYDLDGDPDLLGAGFNDKLDMWENGLFRSDGERRDWVFALDRTRSMINPDDFFTPAKNTLVAYLGERYDTDVDGGDKVGLVTYDYMGSDASNPCAADTEGGVDVKAQRIFEVGSAPASTLITHVAGLSPGSCTQRCTSIGAALRASLSMSTAAAVPGRERVIVLITDGRNNQCPPLEDIVPTIPSDVRLYAVAIGDATDDTALAELATNRGKFYVAGRSTDYTSVQSALRDINADLEADATGKQVLEAVPVPVLARWAEKARRPEVFRLDPVFPRREGNLPIQTVHRVAVDPADTEVRFTLSWKEPSSSTRMVIVDPKGRSYPIAGSRLVREQRGSRFHVVEVLDPLSGIWLVGEQRVGNTGPSKFTAVAAGESRWTVNPEFPLFYPDEALVVRASLGTKAAALPVSEMTATFLSPSDAPSTVTGTRMGDGKFELRVPGPTEPGTWRVTIQAFGSPDRPFGRKWHQAVNVAPRDNGGLDRRRLEIALDRNTLRAGSADRAKVTARLWTQGGQPLTNAQVSFVAQPGALSGSVVNNGDGSYSQTLEPGRRAAEGAVWARTGLFRFDKSAPFRVTPGAASATDTKFYVNVGLKMLCANAPQSFGVVLSPRDALGNPISGAAVKIERAGGPSIRWLGPVRVAEAGALYFREFRPGSGAGTVTFSASVDGVAVGNAASVALFGPDSAEGRTMGCEAFVKGGLPWWLWLILIILALIIVVVVVRWVL